MNLRAGFLLGLAAASALASTPATWEMNTYQDFLKGRFSEMSLSRDGRLMLAPRLETLFASDQPFLWSVAQGPDGALYAGAGHRGRVYRIDKSGKSSVYWTADEPEVFAVAFDPSGKLYAATSPSGKVYRLENGKATEYFAPGEKYIWALAFSKDGTLFAGTGDEGKIFRVDPAGKSELYYDTGQAHITCLAFDLAGRLLAGSEPNGILYQVSGKGNAFVLYDANLPEIREIVPGPDGSIYAAALGGSMGKRVAGTAVLPSATTGAGGVAVQGTSVTVTDDAQRGAEIKPKPETKPPVSPQVTAQFSPLVDYSGVVEKSAIYKINPDHTVETLWSSKDENVYALIAQGRQILFSTDAQGRIYRLGADRKATLLLQTNEGEATRLIATDAGLVAATGNMGKLYRVASDYSVKGGYESPVHDAGTVARWGRLSWRATVAKGSHLSFRTRAGNSARPDRTWSDWSAPVNSPSTIQSPNARYVQWKAEFSGDGSTSPVLENISVAYLPQNNPPVVKSITVTTLQTAAAQKPAQAAAQASTYSITVTDTGESGASSASGTPTQMVARNAAGQMQVTWQAEDPDGDRLLYSLYFRGEDEREWKVIRINMPENSMAFDADVFADGKYYFRVVASDRPANPPETAREADLTSSPVMIDNTPPIVTPGAPRRNGEKLELDIEAVDAASVLRRCEYSLDAGPWTPIEAEDGVTDSPRERFLLRLDNLSAREHLIVIRVYDAGNNAGLAKVVVR